MPEHVADPRRRTVVSLLGGSALALLTFGGLPPRPAAARSLRVSSTAALGEALTTPNIDLIELDEGSYGPLKLKNAGGSGKAPMVVRSADPNKPARLTGIVLYDAHDLTFEDLAVEYTFNAQDNRAEPAFIARGGRNLLFQNIAFRGAIARGVSATVDGFGFGTGLIVIGVDNLTITKNEFSDFFKALSVHESSAVRIIGNNIHDMRSEGMNLSQIDGLQISHNWIHDFRTAQGSPDHPDMIQIWTVNTTKPTRNAEIRDNVLNSGLGPATQSIFLVNNLVSKGLAGPELYFQNVTIKNNVIINAHTNAVVVGASNGLTIENNTLIRNRRSEGKRDNPVLWTPQIKVTPECRRVTIRRNVTFRVSGYKSQADWTVADNYLIQDMSRTKPGYYDQVFANARTGDPRDLASFAYRKDGPLYRAGIGAPQLDTQP